MTCTVQFHLDDDCDEVLFEITLPYQPILNKGEIIFLANVTDYISPEMNLNKIKNVKGKYKIIDILNTFENRYYKNIHHLHFMQIKVFPYKGYLHD